MGPRDHFLVAQPGTDHRVHARIGIDHHFQKRRAVVVHEFLQHGPDTILFAQPDGKLETIGARRIDKIFAVKKFFRSAEPLREKHLLPLPDHAVALVIKEDRLHRQVVIRYRLHRC